MTAKKNTKTSRAAKTSSKKVTAKKALKEVTKATNASEQSKVTTEEQPASMPLIYAKNPKGNAAPKAAPRNLKRTLPMDGLRIKVLCDGNPRREGSLGYQSFAIIQDGMTVREFMAKGGRTRDLRWDFAQGNIDLVP